MKTMRKNENYFSIEIMILVLIKQDEVKNDVIKTHLFDLEEFEGEFLFKNTYIKKIHIILMEIF